MTKTRHKPKGYWNYYPHVEQEALEGAATGRTELQHTNMSAYNAARIHEGWMDNLSDVLKWPDKVPYGHWLVYDNLVMDIWTHRAGSLACWTRHSPMAVAAAYNNGHIPTILEEFGWTLGETGTIPRNKTKKQHAYGALKDREYVLKVANTYDTWEAFTQDSAYSSCVHYGFLDYVKEHTTASQFITPMAHWKSLDNCMQDIKEVGATSMPEWRERSSRGYRGSVYWGHHDVIYETMGWSRRAACGHWDVFSNIVADIEENGYKSLQAFRLGNTTAFLRMQEHGWERIMRIRYNWSKAVESSVQSTYVYQYVQGDRIYIGITVDPDGRHRAHQESTYKEVRELALAGEPTYYERYVEYNDAYAPYAMDRDTALVFERRMIKCAMAQGYEVTNRAHNPQWNGTKYSWETA